MPIDRFQFLNEIQCVNQHKCKSSEDNFFHLLNFKYIAKDPIVLDCGHVVCLSCLKRKKYFYCEKHERMVRTLENPINPEFISEHKSDLFKYLEWNFESIQSLYKGKMKTKF